MSEIDFWYSIGSTYSYLTVMRLPEWARERDLSVSWRPFDVRAIMISQQNVPFKGKPVKTAYMWRDIARRAQKYGLRPSLPAPYPISDLELANRVALLGHRQGWGVAYAREAYRLWFEMGQEAGGEPNMSEALFRAGQEPMSVIEQARADEIGAALTHETETAVALGIFGSPSFVVRDEVFWGDDRLEDAFSWARLGHVT